MDSDDLKELDDLLPPETAEALEAWRELFRAVFTGIPDVRHFGTTGRP